MNFGRHFYGFWLHFGGHFGGQKLQKSMPKLNEKMDAILEGIFGASAEQMGGVGGGAEAYGRRGGRGGGSKLQPPAKS